MPGSGVPGADDQDETITVVVLAGTGVLDAFDRQLPQGVFPK